MTDELGSRQRDLSTSSVTKRANGHWHAIIASSCRWSQREYKRQPVHRINHPFASEPSGGIHYCSSCPRVRNWKMVEPLWGTRASPLWSGLWPCSCVQQSLPLCGVNRVSPHGPVSTRQASLAVLIEPVGRRLLPYTPWRYCRSIRPKHWETCTRGPETGDPEMERTARREMVTAPLPPPERGGTASGGVRGDLRITVRASPSGGSHPSGTLQPAGVPLVRTGASAEWGTPPVSFGASPDDQMSVAASEGEPSLSGDDDSAALPPSGVVALSEPDPEMTAMLSRAAENVGLVWNPPPRPDPSRLDEWFLGGGRAGFQRPPPVPFFPEVHEELTRSWTSECGRYSTAAVVAVSREKEKTVPVKTVTLGVCGGQPPACFSTKRADFSKRVHGWSRLFKDVLSPVRFWVRSISGASGRSRSLPHVSGHSARWGSFRGWFMFFMWSAAGPAASGTQNFNKRAVSSVSGSQEEESGVPCITGSLPSSSLARQGGVAQEHPSCPFVEPGKGSSTQAPATSRHTQAGLLRFLPHEEESGECYTTHPDPAPRHHRPGLHRPRAGSLCSTSLPHHGYVGGSVGAAGTVSRSLASAPQSVSVAPTDHQTRLCDSVRPASPQVQGHPVHFSQTRRCSCLACGNRSPTGEGCDRAGPSSRYEVGVVQPLLHCAQERWWVTTDLGSASFEPCTSQAAVQDVDAETHFWMRPSPRLVGSDRPEGRVLSCLDPPATQAIPAFRVRGTGVSVQGPALRAVPVASRLHQSRGGGPCPPERTRCAHSQLPRRLAHTRTVSQAVVCTQGPGAQAPQPAGPSGQLGKEQTRANAEDLFSRHGVRFGQPNSTPHPGTCSVSAELLQDLIRQDGGSTETLSEAPGAYGCSRGDSSARSAPYETASALALWPNPEVGVETRHLPGSDYTGLPQDLQAVVRSLVPSGRSAPGAGIQACCGIHRCLIHRLGSHVQRARSIRGLDGSPTALAYQLPRVASSTPCPEPSQRAPSAQGRSGPYGQHCDRCVYQPARRFALPSHVATRPPPPPLDSEASEVPSCHPHPRSVQSGSRRAVPSSTSRRVETPSPGGSADLGTVRSCPGRPVCISRNHPLPRVLLPNRGNARHGCTGTQLAPGPAQICVPPSEPTSTDTVQDQGGRGAGLVSGSILAQQDLVPGTHAPRDSPSLANSSEEGSAFSETGHPMAPAPGPVETPRMVPGWDAEVLADLPQEVALTITSARAPSTRRAYTLKWNLFVEWCSSHQEDPRRCSIRAVLSFLQQGLERRLSPSTLKVYVAAISAYHDPVEGKSVGKHDLVVRFLRGARRLNPPRPPSLPSWDLALVLRALITAPFEPLQSVELKFLSMKTLLLTALASIKRVGDLQAFSVDDSCLQFGPADSSATLRPRPGYVPKVPTTPFRDQVVNLQALPPEEADPALALLCPVRALRQYTDRTQSFRTSEQLFVCYGGQQKGKAVSKQRMAHWIVDAITLAYEAQGVPCPLRLRAHSTRGVASSWALARGASLADICRAAGWATPNTFARFYSLRVEPVSSCVLTSNG